ncbi:MAG TPA: twin-arginine translocation signal domain-containing protein [Mycobacteriales bacterium]|nr:twin-arginine translocation signal domain-containing protein [Mycobacteriales bacterium]
MSWFDNAAKSAARRSAGADDVDPSSGLTRRDALKKAGIVGGAALWMTPVLQSITVPAYANSHPQGQTGLDAGAACTSGTECASGSCSGTVGNPGTCQPVNAGGPCGTSANAGTNCTTGVCLAGTCQKNGTGGTCAGNTDCLSNDCIANGPQAGTCKASGAGGACRIDADCAANRLCGPNTLTCGGA